MDSNLKEILEEFEILKGQFVITQSWRIERLIAIGTDDTDYYWITYNGRKKSWNTCVGGLVPLKGKLDDKHYNEFIRLAKLNHYDQATLFGHTPDEEIPYYMLTGKKIEEGQPKITYREFTNKHKIEMQTLHESERFLSDVCWDLN